MLLLLVAIPALGHSDGAQYVYDRTGRLIQVIAPNGASAIYGYDAAGNITSVARITSTTPQVTGLSAWSALSGSQLTIYGSGFSAVPSQNQVTFNGVSATVLSATVNTLVVVVPSGVTAGAVVVTSSNGSASSSVAFSPGTGHPAPNLTSITPRIGTNSDTLTLAGTGLPWGTDNNQATISGTATQVLAVTPLALQIKPNGRSGRVAVTGAYGTALGDIDFFLPSNILHTVAEIEAAAGGTGRLYVDDGVFTPTITTPGKTAMVLMDAVAGEELSLQITGAAFSGGCSSAHVSIYRLSSGQALYGTACARAEYYVAEATGTYMFDVTPSATGTGSVSLKAQSAPTITTAVALGDSATTVTTTVPAQRGAITFPTTSTSQIVSVQITNAQYPTACSNHAVTIGGGPSIVSNPFLSACTNAYAITVPTPGTYRAVVDPKGFDTGSVAIKVDDAPTITTPVSLGAAATTVTTTVPAQQGAITFPTTSTSQIVSVQITNPQYQTACSNHTLRIRGPAPATTQIASRTLCASANPYTFPTAGTYTAFVDPNGFDTGSVAIKVDDAPTLAYSLTLGGSAVAVGTTVPGQIAKATFSSVTANQSVSVIISGSSYPSACANHSLKLTGPAPATTLRGSTTLCSATRTYTLGTVGQYTLTVDPYDFDTGSVSLRVQ